MNASAPEEIRHDFQSLAVSLQSQQQELQQPKAVPVRPQIIPHSCRTGQSIPPAQNSCRLPAALILNKLWAKTKFAGEVFEQCKREHLCARFSCFEDKYKSRNSFCRKHAQNPHTVLPATKLSSAMKCAEGKQLALIAKTALNTSDSSLLKPPGLQIRNK